MSERGDFDCRDCGAKNPIIEWLHPTRDELVEQKLCFTCNFWRRTFQLKDGVIIDGHHYTAKDGIKKDVPDHCLGFGGRHVVIEKNDGTRIETNDLWHQGPLPARYRKDHPDNARFVRQPIGNYGSQGIEAKDE